MSRPSTSFHIRPRLVLSLVAGRGTFRMAGYLSNLALLAAWGRPEFNRYAAAVGSAGWLISLVAAGPEKAALKLLPRARRSATALVAMLRRMAMWLPVPLLLLTAVVVVAAPSARPALYLAAATLYVTQGCNLLTVGVYRALGHTHRDIANFLGLTTVTVALTVLTIVTDLPPVGYLCALLVLTYGTNLAMLAGLTNLTNTAMQLKQLKQVEPVTASAGGAGVTGTAAHRRRLTRLLAGTAVLMATAEVLSNAAASFLFVVLALSAHAGQSADLYLMWMGWTVTVSLFQYLLRVFQPRTALRLGGSGARRGRHRALGIARVVVLLDLVWLGVAAAVIAAAGLADVPAGLPAVLVLGGLMLSRAPLFVLMNLGAYLMENADTTSLRASALSATAGLVAVVMAGVVFVPALGAVGAVYALAFKELAVGTSILWHYGRQRTVRPATAPVPVDGGTA